MKLKEIAGRQRRGLIGDRTVIGLLIIAFTVLALAAL
jgi:hypothetical protein